MLCDYDFQFPLSVSRWTQPPAPALLAFRHRILPFHTAQSLISISLCSIFRRISSNILTFRIIHANTFGVDTLDRPIFRFINKPWGCHRESDRVWVTFITTFYSFYHQMYPVCRRKHFKGDLSLTGDWLGTPWWVSYTQVSPYISFQSPLKAATLLSSQPGSVLKAQGWKSENYLIWLLLAYVYLDLGLDHVISNIPFHQKFICNSLFSSGQSLTSRNCLEMFASFVEQFTKLFETIIPLHCKLINNFCWKEDKELCGKKCNIDKAIIVCAEMRELIHT